MPKDDTLLKSSILLYREAIMREVDKHKWYLSEHVGHDVGYEVAFIDWILKHKRTFDMTYHKTTNS